MNNKKIDINSFQAILNQSPDGIIVVNSNGKITYSNSAMTDIFGYTKEEFQDMIVETLIPEKFKLLHVHHRKQYKAKPYVREMGQNLNITGITKSKKEIPLDIKLSPSGYGQDFQVTAVIRDARHIKKMKDQLHENSNRLERLNSEMKILIEQLKTNETKLKKLTIEKDTILGITVHDIRSPLSAILGYAKILEKKEIGELNEDQIKLLLYIQKQSKYILDYVQDILDLSAINQGIYELKLENTDIQRLVEDIVTVERINADKKNINIIQNHNINFTKINIDKLKIEQVIRNILNNAIKFTPKNQKINVSITESDKEICISIKDEGPGLSENDIKILFEPFKRGSAVPTGDEHSSGLGLSIADKIILLHKGKIEVNNNKNKGAIFQIYLPK